MSRCLTYYPNVVSLINNRYLSVAAYLEVAGEPGGDFYEYYEYPEGKISFIIGDVSGKGPKAAQYMHFTRGIFRELIKENPSAAELICQLNQAVSAVFDRLHFVTLTYVEVDPINKHFSYIRAGHCPLLLYSALDKNCHYLEDSGLGLGIIRNNIFSANMYEYRVAYNRNDILVLFTDGLIETTDKTTDHTFGLQGLQRSLEQATNQPVVAICSTILNAYSQQVTEPRNPDDLALIVIKFA